MDPATLAALNSIATSLGPVGAIVVLAYLVIFMLRGGAALPAPAQAAAAQGTPVAPACLCSALADKVTELEAKVDRLCEIAARLDERTARPSSPSIPLPPPMRSTLPTPRDR